MGNMLYRKTLLIDLDCVLNQYTGKYDENIIPLPKIGVSEFLEKLSVDYDLKIFTTRNLLLTSKWLIENKLDKYIKDVTNVKTTAYLHIDDRCVCFCGDYNNTIEQIEKFKVYWK